MGYHSLLQRIFLTQGLNPRLLRPLHGQADSLPRWQLGSPMRGISVLTKEILGSYFTLSGHVRVQREVGVFPTEGSHQVSCVSGGFFTIWVTREIHKGKLAICNPEEHFHQNPVMLVPWSQTSILLEYEREISVDYKPFILWYFVVAVLTWENRHIKEVSSLLINIAMIN